MPHFDFHIHPVFKRFICKYESSYPTARDAHQLIAPIDMRNPVTDLSEELFLHMLESQSCITQMNEGQLMLGVASIAPLEEIFAAKKGLFGKILNSRFWTSPLDHQYFNLVRDRRVSYYQLFIRELNLYKHLTASKQISLFCRKETSQQGTFSLNGTNINLVIGIEGGHALSRCLIGKPGEKDVMSVTGKGDAISNDFNDNDPAIPTAAASLRRLQTAMWAEGMDICYLILTHLSHIPEQMLATHAYGMKMIDHDAAYPAGNGITQAGYDVIDAAYTLEVGNRSAKVLIDIKHMGLKSRIDLYQYRRENGYENIPLIASHVGVTGCTIREWTSSLDEARLIKRNGIPYVGITIDRKQAGEWGVINKGFTFNAWSINLMDDDIEEVLKSKGLIGMSLDARILGWQNILGKGDKEEFLSWEDFRFFFPGKAAAMARDVAFAESRLVPTSEERHPLALCFNILHIVAIGKLMGDDTDPWKHICIGSDYDGLINPIINCRDAGDLPDLEKSLLKWLPVAERAYLKETPGLPLLPYTRGQLDLAQLRAIVKDLLYENGRRLLDAWVKI